MPCLIGEVPLLHTSSEESCYIKDLVIAKSDVIGMHSNTLAMLLRNGLSLVDLLSCLSG